MATPGSTMDNLSTDIKDQHTMHLEGSTDNRSEKGVDTLHFEVDATTAAAERRITRKIDFRLLPILAALYTISLVDRTNLGGARISGINQALGLDLGDRYSVVVLVFYVGYIIFELPSNIGLRRFGAANWLSALALIFGVVTLSMGLVKNYASLVVLRVLLGAMEAGLFPGCVYLISAWYRRYEVQKRIAFFYSFSAFASSFANILAYGLTQIADDPEQDGWKWIFIVQGCITCGLAIIAWFVVVDFPDSKRNKFLNAEEKQILVNRLLSERGESEGEKVTPAIILEVIKMWHLWTVGLVYMGASCGLYGFLFFLPIILRKSFGYSQISSFCLTAPPAAFAIIVVIAISWIADKTRIRGPYAVLECIIGIAGLAMTGFLESATPRYVGTFLGVTGTTALIATSLAWGQNNIRSDARRNVATVVQIICAAVGGIYSALVFRQQDAPNYVPGIVACGALLLLGAFLGTITSFFLWRANKRADRGELVIEDSPEFRYTW